MIKFNLVKEIRELKTQLSYSKQYGFFFGAGTSCALRVPNISQLTTKVEQELEGDNLTNFYIIKKDLESTYPDKTINIEDILNHTRQIRSITGEKDDKNFIDVSGAAAVAVDSAICKIIYIEINSKEIEADLSNTKKFFAWLNMLNRDYPKEVFTSNYDLIIEKSLEAIRVPHFDGFVGSYEPFFWQESIDRFVDTGDLTNSWIRLWKIHGSLNWFWKEDESNGSYRIVRTGKIQDIEDLKNELVIYPSKEKYDSSKKQPFVAYFDRFKNTLTKGELLFIFTGYSFSDQHINEIVFNALRQNNRLFVLVFFFSDNEVESLYKYVSPYPNLTVYGPTKAIIDGILGEWEYSGDHLKDGENSDSYWDSSVNKMTLGDFNMLVNFFITQSGKKENIEIIANG